MSYRTFDTLMFVATVVMVMSQVDRINVWLAYPIVWAFGRWLTELTKGLVLYHHPEDTEGLAITLVK